MRSSKIITLLFPFLHTIVCAIAYEKKTEYFRVECVSDIEHCNLHVNNMKVAPTSCPQDAFCFQHDSHMMLYVSDKPKSHIDVLLDDLWPNPRVVTLTYSEGNFQGWGSKHHFEAIRDGNFQGFVSKYDFGPICESVHLIIRDLKSENSFPDIAAFIKMNSKVTAVTINYGTVLSPNSWKILAETLKDSPHVLTLELSEVNLTTPKVEAFHKIFEAQPNNTLKSLSVGGWLNIMSISIEGKMTTAQTMTQNNFDNLLRCFSALQSLTVERMSGINDFKISVLMPHLTSFAITSTFESSYSPLFKSLHDNCPSLTSLKVNAVCTMGDPQFTEEDAQLLGKLTNLRQLDFMPSLVFPGSKVTDVVLKAIADNLISLEHLSVGAQSITNDSAKELAKLSSLTDLSLIGSSNLTFDFLRDFEQVGKAKLMRLDLSGCKKFADNIDELASFIEKSPTLVHFIFKNVLRDRWSQDVAVKVQKLQNAYAKNAKTGNMKGLILEN